MPFDATEMSPHDKLRALAAAGRGEMPEGFTWDFTVIHEPRACGTAGCMLGIGIEMGLISKDREIEIFDQLGMHPFTYVRIFASGRATYGVTMDRVTPAMVADEIDRFLASVEAKAEVV